TPSSQWTFTTYPLPVSRRTHLRFNLGAAWCGEIPLVVSPGREHLPSIGQSDPPIVVKRAETLLPSDAAAAATAMTMPAAITPYSMAVTPLRSAVACASR